MNESTGKIFRPQPRLSGGRRSDPSAARVLVVDTVLAARVALAQAISQPGIQVETANGFEDALRRITREEIALVITEDTLGDRTGIELLTDLRERAPHIRRVLVAEPQRLVASKEAIKDADITFLVAKPWDSKTLRENIREILEAPKWADWSSENDRSTILERLEASDSFRDQGNPRSRDHDLLVCGLLAGLNACESEIELFELIHSELMATYHVGRWIWVDEEERTFTRVAGDWPIDTGLNLAELSESEKLALERSRGSTRVTRLDQAGSALRSARGTVCVSLAIRIAGHRTISCLAWVDAREAGAFVILLRDLQRGLQMAIGRIRSAQARAVAAHQLACRVSEELRTPVGALTHAIDRLRGEAERAGLPSEWVDRVTSESERVKRAVKQVEDEMLGESARMAPLSS